jgi:hypothetical protein
MIWTGSNKPLGKDVTNRINNSWIRIMANNIKYNWQQFGNSFEENNGGVKGEKIKTNSYHSQNNKDTFLEIN